MSRSTPAQVRGLGGPVEEVALGGSHTCALGESGGVMCWGYNGYGQLGDGTGADNPVPVDVEGLTSGVSDIASGQLHTCAVLSGGQGRCWGFGESGALGDGHEEIRLEPVNVLNLGNLVQVDGGEDAFTCAVTTVSSAHCWGNNEAGHLGNGETKSSSVPFVVTGLGSGVDSVSAGGNHACALMTDGTVRCWSENYEGQLGNGEEGTESHVPVEVSGLDDVVEITTGAFHSCALTEGGDVYCWGFNDTGQLGDGSKGSHSEPERILTIDNISSIAGGYFHTCAVDEDGRVYCWGGNHSGQLGTGNLDPSNEPVEVILAEPAGAQRTWGDDDCDGDVDSVDSLKNLRFVAALSVAQEEGCPGFGAEVDVAGVSPHPWGDVDCDEDVDSVDALKILRHVAALAVIQPKGCPDIGAAVIVTVTN